MNVVTAVAADVKEDCCITCSELASSLSVSMGLWRWFFMKTWALLRSWPDWCPSSSLRNTKGGRQKVSLSCNLIMEETMVCYHMPDVTKKSKLWIEPCQAGLKAKVHARKCCLPSLTLLLVWATLCYIPDIQASGQSVPAEVFFHWDNVLVPTAVLVKKWFADHSIQLLQRPPILGILLQRNSPCSGLWRRSSGGLSIDEDSLKKTWEGVIRTIASAEFAIIFRWWFEFRAFEQMVDMSRKVEK